MEDTGGYEYTSLKGFVAHKLDAAVINPRRVRDYAKGIGLDAKTDPIDAKVIAQYAEVVAPKSVKMKSDQVLKHSALVARRTQSLELINLPMSASRFATSYHQSIQQFHRRSYQNLLL